MNVLILHPDQVIADSLSGFLNDYGFNALPLSDPYDAWVEVQEYVFEVALTCTEMPNWTGIPLPEWLQDGSTQAGRCLGIILLGLDDAPEIVEIQGANYECLPVPCNIRVLVQKVLEAAIRDKRSTEFL